ncbi:HTH domain-containing protein [Streptomyces alkaliphilus]|uniref:HTH domain-containing protein n=2 Tax=Streptomyces TaxID=1883 RepID=A0A7W3TCM0_9ACTN|nr:HTH domain-containing protein [Streptomyces alkaliphilus]
MAPSCHRGLRRLPTCRVGLTLAPATLVDTPPIRRGPAGVDVAMETGTGIGLDKKSETLYVKLLLGLRWTPEELGRELDRRESEVICLIDGLREEGLVVASGDVPGAYRAVEPCVALPALLSRRMHAPQMAQPRAAAIERFVKLHEYTTDRVSRPDSGHSRDETATLVERLIARAERDVIFLVPGGSPDGPGDVDGSCFELSKPIIDMSLRRGATVRSLWTSSALSHPAGAEHARWMADQGAQLRHVGSLPVRAIVVDGELAVQISEDRTVARVVRGGGGLERLNALADQLWQRGVGLRSPAGRAVSTGPRRPRSETVLRLLAEGLTDDAIARRLGCSVRTVRNDIACAMSALDARSRFQAGARARQVGLI